MRLARRRTRARRARQRILAKIGLTASDLRCGGDEPLANNCSGKHAGILALAQVLDAPIEGYLDPDHPAQQMILTFCARVFGEALGPDRLATDGCGFRRSRSRCAPVRAPSRAWRAQESLDDDHDRAVLRRVHDAMVRHPWFVGGTGRFDTDLMTAAPGILAKVGAEGVHGSASGRGRHRSAAQGRRRRAPGDRTGGRGAARKLGAIDAGTVATLASHARPAVHNLPVCK